MNNGLLSSSILCTVLSEIPTCDDLECPPEKVCTLSDDGQPQCIECAYGFRLNGTECVGELSHNYTLESCHFLVKGGPVGGWALAAVCSQRSGYYLFLGVGVAFDTAVSRVGSVCKKCGPHTTQE